MKLVRGEAREESANFAKENRYKSLYGPGDEQNKFDAKIQEYEERVTGFSFEKMIKLKKNFWISW